MLWKDLKIEEDHVFEDGSVLTQIHETHNIFCYKFWLKKHPKHIKDNSITVSEDHYILCETKRELTKPWKEYILQYQEENIPKAANVHVSSENGEMAISEEAVEFDYWDCGDSTYWLSAKNIFMLLNVFGKRFIKPVDNLFTKWEAVGEKECFCISTDLGKYKCCGVINHNSVAIRNIIFHALTHGEDVKIALVDLKVSEFAAYKGMNNVVGVANTTREACELLRLCREVMQKRNIENSKRGLTDIADYVPQKPTDRISLFGVEYPEDTVFDVEIAGEKKQMSLKEILEYVQKNY